MSIDLEAIRARIAAATPGPWRSARNVKHAVMVGPEDAPRHICAFGPLSIGTADDTALIAHAPADLASLCDEVERLREILAGRTQAPTPEEVDAHAKHGRWRGVLPGGRIFTARFPGETERHWRGTRWWAIDETETPCAWPVVTGGVE